MKINGVETAVAFIIRETDNEFFKSLSQNLENNTELRNLLYDVLILGLKRTFSISNPTIDLAYRYGYIERLKDRVKIFNKIFEIVISNYFVSKNETLINLTANEGLINEITHF